MIDTLTDYKRKGFSFIELIMVVVILGIIAVLAIPIFINMQDEAKQSAEQATAGAVRAGIHSYYVQSQILNRQPQYPATLDGSSNGPVSNVNPFFDNVCSISAIQDWWKDGLLYTGPTGSVYTYKPALGTFESGMGLLYAWSMNEGAGYGVGEGAYSGQVHGNAQWQAGKVGSALHFGAGADGLGAYVQVPDSSTLELTTAGTVETWIYADSLIPNQGEGIVHKGDAVDFSDEAYSLQFWTGNTIAMLVNNGSGYNLVQTTVDLTPGQWYHVVGTWDSSGMKIYLNGQLNNSNTIAAVAQKSSGALNIGAQLSSSYGSFNKNLPFSGAIDEVKIYDTALSVDEISAYYNSTK